VAILCHFDRFGGKEKFEYEYELATLGAASAVISPALAALSLGIVGRKSFPARVSRNESFNHGGNFAAAILAGTIGQRFG
jgi:hypothetical protein